MLWYQNSFLLDGTERRSMDRKGDKYCLRIRNFQVSDFGNYSCVADNALGRTKKYIEVSGSPGPAIFLSPAYSGYLDLYNVTWTIESIPPLEEVRLLYRKLLVSISLDLVWPAWLTGFSGRHSMPRESFIWFQCDFVWMTWLLLHSQMNDSYQHPGKWQDVALVPTVTRSEANHFVMSHIVRGLERNSVYEAVIHAKNRYGWNEVSGGGNLKHSGILIPQHYHQGIQTKPH